MKKAVSLLLIISIFVLECLQPLSAEKTLWDERRFQPTQMASLSQTMAGNTHIRSVLPDFKAFQSLPAMKTKQLTQGIPQDVASIREINIHPASDQKIIYYMQDVHLNEEAQKNIALTLSTLMEENKIDVVALEGAEGKIPVNEFNQFENKEIRNLAASNLLEENFISGPIYSGFINDHKIPLFYGIEKNNLYKLNIQAMQHAAPLRKSAKENLQQIEFSLMGKKRTGLNPASLKLVQKIEAFNNNQFTLANYLKYLSQFESFSSPEVEIFLSAYDLEGKLDFKKVETDRANFLQALLQKLNPEEIDLLTKLSSASKAEKIKQSEFYSNLEQLAEKKGIHINSYGSVRDYIQYILLTDGINTEKLFSEIDQMEEIAIKQSVKNNSEISLIHLIQYVGLIEKLTDFSLTTSEWKKFKRLKKEVFAQIENPALLNQISEISKFYEVAELRDHAMATNTLSMFKNNVQSVFLVTGGFHATGMTEIFKKNGITVISITPKLTSISSKENGKTIDFFTRELTPLDKLFRGEKLFLSTKPLQIIPSTLGFAAQETALSNSVLLSKNLIKRLRLTLVLMAGVKLLREIRIKLISINGEKVNLQYKLDKGAISGRPTIGTSVVQRIIRFISKLNQFKFSLTTLSFILTPSISWAINQNGFMEKLTEEVGMYKIPFWIFASGIGIVSISLVFLFIYLFKFLKMPNFTPLDEVGLKANIATATHNIQIGTERDSIQPVLKILVEAEGTIDGKSQNKSSALVPAFIPYFARPGAQAKAKDIITPTELNEAGGNIQNIFDRAEIHLKTLTVDKAVSEFIFNFLYSNILFFTRKTFAPEELRALGVKLYGIWLTHIINNVDITNKNEVEQAASLIQGYNQIYQELFTRDQNNLAIPSKLERFIFRFESIINLNMFTNPFIQNIFFYLAHPRFQLIHPQTLVIQLRNLKPIIRLTLGTGLEQKNSEPIETLNENVSIDSYILKMGIIHPAEEYFLEREIERKLKINLALTNQSFNPQLVTTLARILFLLWLENQINNGKEEDRNVIRELLASENDNPKPAITSNQVIEVLKNFKLIRFTTSGDKLFPAVPFSQDVQVPNLQNLIKKFNSEDIFGNTSPIPDPNPKQSFLPETLLRAYLSNSVPTFDMLTISDETTGDLHAIRQIDIPAYPIFLDFNGDLLRQIEKTRENVSPKLTEAFRAEKFTSLNFKKASEDKTKGATPEKIRANFSTRSLIKAVILIQIIFDQLKENNPAHDAALTENLRMLEEIYSAKPDLEEKVFTGDKEIDALNETTTFSETMAKMNQLRFSIKTIRARLKEKGVPLFDQVEITLLSYPIELLLKLGKSRLHNRLNISAEKKSSATGNPFRAETQENRDDLFSSFFPEIKSRKIGELTKNLILEEDKPQSTSLTIIEITNTDQLNVLIQNLNNIVNSLSSPNYRGFHSVIFVNRSQNPVLKSTLTKMIQSNNNSHLIMGVMNEPSERNSTELAKVLLGVLSLMNPESEEYTQYLESIKEKKLTVRLMAQTDKWSSAEDLVPVGSRAIKMSQFEVKIYLLNKLLDLLKEKEVVIRGLNNMINILKKASAHA